MGVRSTNPTQSFIDDFFRSGTDASGALNPVTPAGISATGGTKTSVGDYTYHFIASSSDNLAVSSVSGPGAVEFIVIGGGGGGGYSQNGSTRRGGGGGGAGGLITNWPGHPYSPRCPSPTQNLVVTAQTYNITIGGGGPGGSAGSGTGSNTTAFGLTASGGGYGGANEGQNAGGGGSGGGAGATANTGSNPGAASPNSDPDRQGHSGGAGASDSGGAGAVGNAGSEVPDNGKGGIGVAFPDIPSSYGTTGPTPGRWLAGGGSGGS